MLDTAPVPLARAQALKGVTRTAIVAPIKTTLLYPELNADRWTVELVDPASGERLHPLVIELALAGAAPLVWAQAA